MSFKDSNTSLRVRYLPSLCSGVFNVVGVVCVGGVVLTKVGWLCVGVG